MNPFKIENCKTVLNAAKSMPSNHIEFSFPSFSSFTELNARLMQNPLYDPFGPSFGTMW